VNVLLVLIIAAIFLVGLPGTFILITWIRSFNRHAIVYREVGKEPGLAEKRRLKYKPVQRPNIGKYIKFFLAGRSYPDSNYFGSQYWRHVKDGKKDFIGIPLYMQRDTYRPIVFALEPKPHLYVVPEDSREFKLRSYIAKQGDYENNRLYMTAIAGLLIFLVVLGLFYVITYYGFTHESVRTLVQTAPQAIQVGV